MKVRRTARLLILFLFLGFPISLQAQVTGDLDFTQGYFLKTVPLSFGGAYRAIADGNAAILYNPAGLAQNQGQVTVSGDYLHQGYIKSNVFSASVVDFKASPSYAFGLSYDRDNLTLAGNAVTVQQITAAAATKMGEMIFVGLSAKGYLSDVDNPLINGPDDFDMDVGFLVRPIELLSLAVTMHNLIQGNEYEEFPMELGFGAALHLPPYVRLAVDFEQNFKTPAPNTLNAYFGGEFQASEGIFLRGGFGLDRVLDNNFYSLGLFLGGPKVNVGFTFSQRLNPVTETYGASAQMLF